MLARALAVDNNRPPADGTQVIDISPDDYVRGVIALGWPDGPSRVKLPTGQTVEIQVADGQTGDLALFVWNYLSPGTSVLSVAPGRSRDGLVAFRSAAPERRATARQEQQTTLDRDDRELTISIREVMDRLGTPIDVETVGALLAYRKQSVATARLIATLRIEYQVDDFGVVLGDGQPLEGEASVLPLESQWDNIEQAYWELEAGNSREEPLLERRHRKKKRSNTDGLEYHLDEIRHRLLSSTQEEQLGRAIQRGQEAEIELHGTVEDHDRKGELGLLVRAADEAREQFLSQNLRLAFNIAQKYGRQIEGSALDLADLLQAGYVGLHRAVERFDPNRGLRFSTYATWWIRQAVSRHIGDKSRTVRLPIHIHDRAAAVVRTRDRLEVELWREATVDEIAGRAGLSVSEVGSILSLPKVVPLDQVVDDDETRDWREEDIHDRIDASDSLSPILDAIRLMSPRQARVLELRYGLDGGAKRTLEEIGQEFHVTRERIRQLEKKALAALRQSPYVLALTEGDSQHHNPSIVEHIERTSDQEAAWDAVRARARLLEKFDPRD